MYIPSIRPGRIASAIAAAAMAASLVATPAFADSRVVATIGADLTAEQQQTVISYFGSSMNGAQVIYVTNADEHAHLDGYVPYEQIGNATYSCALICPTSSGGIHVRAANLNYVTADMLASALSSAGVRNADVIAICPFKVSGTGALTGVMLAYETATGTALDTTKKDVATQELVVTQSISSQVGSDAATLIVNDVKASVVMNGVTDQAQIDAIVDTTVNNIVNNTNVTNNTYVDNSSTYVDNSTTVIDNSTVNVTEVTVNNNASGLSDEDIAALKQLAYSYAQAGYDYADMAETLATVSQNASAASGIADPMADQLADAAADAAQGGGDATQTNAGTAETSTTADATTDASGTTTTETSSDATAADGTAADGTADMQDGAPSIFDATDDAALGEDVLVTATDEGAAADTDAADEAPAGTDASQADATTENASAADNGEATGSNDPFAGLNWDESGSSTEQDATADAAATEQPAGSETADGSTATEEVGAGTSTAAIDLAGAPVPAQGNGVSLSARAATQASKLVDGTAIVTFEENGAYGLADIVDGNYLTQAAYTGDFKAADGLIVATQAADGKQVLLDAQGKQLLADSYDEVRVLSESWVLGVQKDAGGQAASTDVYYLPGNTAQACATLGAGRLFDAQASGAYLNVAAAGGAVSAYGANFTAVEGAAPTSLDDFSYVVAQGEAADTQDAGTEAAGADTAGAEQATESDAAGADDAAADQPADGGAGATASTLPADAAALADTKDALYTVRDADGKTHLLDAAGADLFAQGFDQVISDHDGAVVVLVDKTGDVAWAYDVTVPASQQG